MDLTGGIIDYIYWQREITENELTILEELLAKHRNFLPFKTDYEEIHFKDEMVSQKNSLIYCDIPEKMIVKKWVWDFDLSKQYKQGYNTRMNVMAVKFYIV
jgi:hypothetical protein